MTTELLAREVVDVPAAETWVARLTESTYGRGRELRLFGNTDSPLLSVAHAGPYSVFFDGLLHNGADLHALYGDIHDANCNPATLVLRAYRVLGEDALQRLRGIYALLIWDGDNDTLLVAKDALGVYALFYARVGTELFVSTCIDALVRLPDVPAHVDPMAVVDHFCSEWPDPEATIYSAVKRVLGGHALRVHADSQRQYLWWKPVLKRRPQSVEQDIEQFDTLVDQAVSRCLQRGHAGISLSGGIDSVLVALAATEVSRRQGIEDPTALSLLYTFPGGLDEEYVQRGVTAKLGLPHILLRVEDPVHTPGTLMSWLDANSALPAPDTSVWYATHRNLAIQAKERGCRFLLTGNGGDEWQVITTMSAARYMLARDVIGLYSMYKGAEFYTESRRKRLRIILWQYGLAQIMRDTMRRAVFAVAPQSLHARRRKMTLQSLPAWLAPDPTLRRDLLARREATWPTGNVPYDPLTDMRATLNNTMVSLAMEEIFETSRRLGLTSLHPLLDVDLVEFCLQLKTSVVNLGHRPKGLARRRLTASFPELRLSEQKKISAMPFVDSLLFDQGARALEDCGGTRALSHLGVVDESLLFATVRDVASERKSHTSYPIWEVLQFETWLRRHL